MTFLTPIPAITAACLAVPALLVLYFLKLRRRPVRVSSTLLWVQATRDLQVNIPLRLIRPSWLLALQLLILALFLLAMARPAIDAAGASAERLVLLIDRSASMSANDVVEGSSRVTRLDRAKTLARRWIASKGGGSTVAVVAFAGSPEIVFNFSTDRSGAELAVDAVTPTDQPGDLAAALRLAGAMLAGDADEAGVRVPGVVVLVSDGSFAAADGLSLPGAEFRFERVGPEREALDNLGIAAISARRERDDPGAVRLFARVVNAGPREAAAPLVLAIDGREIERRPVLVPAGAESAGELAVTFSFRSRDGGLCTLRLDRADALPADDAVSMILNPATKPRLVVAVRDPRPGVEPMHWVVTNILDELELPYRVMPAAAFESDARGGGLSGFDLAITIACSPAAMPPIPSISFGGASPATAPGYFVSWQRTHPLLREVSLDTVFVSRAVPLAEPAAGGAITELARGPAGPFIVERDEGAVRRVNVAFDPADSTWPLSPSFTVFLAGAIDDLTMRSDDRAGRSFTTAEPASITPPRGDGPLTLDGPVRLTIDRPVAGGPTPLGVLHRAGVYRILNAPAGAAPASTAVAVNLTDSVESALRTGAALRVGGDPVAAAASGGGPRELWPWLVGAALALLTVEWLLHARLTRA